MISSFKIWDLTSQIKKNVIKNKKKFFLFFLLFLSVILFSDYLNFSECLGAEKKENLINSCLGHHERLCELQIKLEADQRFYNQHNVHRFTVTEIKFMEDRIPYAAERYAAALAKVRAFNPGFEILYPFGRP